MMSGFIECHRHGAWLAVKLGCRLYSSFVTIMGIRDLLVHFKATVQFKRECFRSMQASSGKFCLQWLTYGQRLGLRLFC